jgi:transcription elongation GreA/GreB family factor
MTQAIKLQLYRLCQEYVDKRIQSSRDAIAEAQQSANEETRSSSGDRYETGRAMMQLEVEKNTQQLSESLKLKNVLDQIRLDISASSVQPGSLVVTDRAVFFLAISLGKIAFEGKSYFVIAPASPLGLELVGAKVGERVTFRNETYVVQEIK